VVEGAITFRTELPTGGRVTEEALNVGLTSVDDELVSATLPAKPPEGVTLIVVVFDSPPATRVRKYLVADRTKVGPETVT